MTASRSLARHARPSLHLPLLLVLAAGCAGGGEGETADPAADTSATSASTAADTGFVLADVGFRTPESVLHDSVADVYLVSNIDGGPGAKDDNGFVSRVSPEGRLLELRWIDGASEDVTLHAPKGLALSGDSLFVADVDSIRVFHRETGVPLGALAVPGATFLNDLASGPDGTLYATDTGVRVTDTGLEPSGTDALYRFEGGQPIAIAEGEQLGGPNGVAVDARGPVVVSFGSGRILRVGDDGALQELAAPPAGQLDGVVLLAGGDMIVTGWEGSAVYHITAGGEVHTIWQDIDSPADLGFDYGRSRMLVPSFNGNRVEVRPTH
ncbi:MAG: SMP-30/gluconolactonase/LRE family protein [Gemmatimonadota bacterium]